MSLDIRYRPRNFDEVIGNEEAVFILKSQLKKNNKERSHTYLFFGGHGCGKTTLANVMANKCDCKHIITINTADDRGIETARSIIENSKNKFIDGKNKCFILDECHKTNDVFQNALLKVLEEPPDFVYFMLCTTNPEKLLFTVKSRCTRVNLKVVKERPLKRHLKNVCEKENKDVDIDVISEIVRVSNGHVRDSLKLLEAIFDIEDKEIIYKIINNYNVEEQKKVIELCRKLLNGNWKDVRLILKGLTDDVEKIRWAVLGYMSSVILSDNENNSKKAALVIEYFKKPFYDSKKAGLYQACYNIF